MSILPKTSLFGLLSILSITCWPAPASAVTTYRQTIQNNTGQDATDFTAVFTGPAGTLGTVQLRDPTTGTTSSGVASGLTVEFATGSFPTIGTMPPGTTFIEWQTGNRTNVLDKTLSRWTSNGIPIGANTRITVGNPERITRQQFLALLDFTNPDAVAVTYSNIRVFADNSAANFNLDQAFTPTGTLVSGLPTSLTLQPGQTAELSFAVTSPLTYDLAFADVAAVDNPGALFQVATAEFAVPEPTTLTLLGFGAATLIGCSLRRKATGRRSNDR
jgi:hypothetical protein